MNIANPLECYSNPGIRAWLFTFGAYTEVYAFGASLECALETAAWWLRDNEPGRFTDNSELQVDDDGNAIDHTYTEAGWLPSWEWWVTEINPADLADMALAELARNNQIEAPEFKRDDIMLAWWHYLSRRNGDQWSSPHNLRLLRLEEHFKPYGFRVMLTGIGQNAAAIYGRLAISEPGRASARY